MLSPVRSSSLARFSRGLADVLRLPRTAARIVNLLARSRRQLSVPEIVAKVRMSERSVRGNLALLLRRGILERTVVVTARKRVAYLYRLRPIDELLRAVSGQFTRSLKTLRRAARGRISPRTAASGRS